MKAEERATNITDLVLAVHSKSECKKFIEQGITSAIAEERERILALIKTANHYGIDKLIDPEELATAIRKEVKP